MITAHPRTNQPQTNPVQRALDRYYPDLKPEELEYLSWLHRKKTMQRHWSDWIEDDLAAPEI